MLNINEEQLIKIIKKKKFTVLPDFFLDIVIEPNMSYPQLINKINTTFNRGGGNIPGSVIEIVMGGNACNVAQALGCLGCLPSFISETSALGYHLLEFEMRKLGVRIIVSTTGTLASTVIFEIPNSGEKNNVMFNSPGSLPDYSPDKLTTNQWKILQDSSCIVITNIQNQFFESLVQSILDEIPSSTFVSIDFSDLTSHQKRIPNIIKEIFISGSKTPSMIVGNENEIKILNKSLKSSPKVAVRQLSYDYPEILFGLHMTRSGELWLSGELLNKQASYQVEVKRSSGAGDAWHAGLLLGLQGNLSYENALNLANSSAGFKIANNRYGSLKDIVLMTQMIPKHA